ncbi:MAG: hypothetical protein O2890_05465 [Cyanobacteria bacterium]|nr:hypothetical protein [Cyanobacteriota bacterium]MDA0865854.1 hypothetical protein [Cyanobacteriota bacterium]
MRFCHQLGLCLSGLLVLVGCTPRLNVTGIEAEIKADIERQGRRISLLEVRCPPQVVRQAGAYFRCVGTLKPEGEFTINVTQADDEGAVNWDIPNSQIILNLVKLEANIQEELAKRLAKRAIIDCGAVYRVNQPGEQFECQVVGGLALGAERIETILVKVTPEGDLSWHEVRESNLALGAASTPTTSAVSGAASTTGASPESQADNVPNASAEKVAGTREVERPRIAGDDD